MAGAAVSLSISGAKAMGRARRAADGGYVYHVLNRANGRMPIFESDDDFAAFEQILEEGRDRYEMRILAYCLLWNHWHHGADAGSGVWAASRRDYERRDCQRRRTSGTLFTTATRWCW